MIETQERQLAVARVLEPLNKATENFLRPPRLRETDHLFLWTAQNGKDFCLDLRAMKKQDAGYDTQADAGPLFSFVKIERSERWIELGYPSYHATEFIRRIPERKRLDPFGSGRANYHEIAATDTSALLVSHCWPEDKIHFRPPGITPDGEWQFEEDGLAKVTYELLLETFFGQTERARKIAEFKAGTYTVQDPPNFVDRADRPLAEYQKFAAIIGPLSPVNLGLFADRGTGKTPIGVSAASHLGRISRMEGDGMVRVLVLCPGQVRTNWKVEFDRFATVPGKVAIVAGEAMNRLKTLIQSVTAEEDCGFSATITSYDTAASETLLPALLEVPWDLVILDESHKYKSSSTKRWKAVKKIAEKAKRTLPMTGTPIGNSPMDLWTQLETLGRGQSGFRSFSAFKKFYGQWAEVGNLKGIERLTGIKNVPLLQERLARCTFQITKEEAGLALPDKVYDYYEVEWSDFHRKFYARIEREIELEIENDLSGTVNNLTVNNILTKLLRLAQVTSGHIRWDSKQDPDTGIELEAGRVEQIVNPNPKVEGVIEMLTDEERDPLGKTIVWCYFVEDIVALMARFEEKGIDAVSYYGTTSANDREEAVRRFNEDPNCRVIVANAQTAGEGLNLVGYDWFNDEPKQKTYTDHEIFFSCNWSALDRGQAEDRAHRRGTRSHVRITDLVIPGTIDVEIRERVRGKIEMADATLDIRAVLDAVLGTK